jgi:hypothetical protein
VRRVVLRALLYKATLLRDPLCIEGSDLCGRLSSIGPIRTMWSSCGIEQGQQVATKQVTHTVEGLTQLTTFLLGIVGTPERLEDLACSIETNHGLLIAALLEVGFPVYPVNPKTVDRHRKPAGAKTDAIDAYLLARTGRESLR